MGQSYMYNPNSMKVFKIMHTSLMHCFFVCRFIYFCQRAHATAIETICCLCNFA